MARKLYIFVPTGRVKTDAQRPAQWVGGFTANYSYLGDCHARQLGMGNNFTPKRLPGWVHASASNAKYIKGGASRSDRNFRGWG